MEKYIQSYLKEEVDNYLLVAIINGLEESDKKILMKIFGKNYNENMYRNKTTLSYIENMELERAIKNINDNIMYAKRIYEKTNNYKYVSLNIRDKIKNPIPITGKKKVNISLKKDVSIQRYLNCYHLSLKEVEDILNEASNHRDFLLYAYYYGINRPKMEIDKIYEILKLGNMPKREFKKRVYEEEKEISRLMQRKHVHNEKNLQMAAGESERRTITRRPENFLDYFEPEEQNKVRMIIPLLQKNYLNYYQAIYTCYTKDLKLKTTTEKYSKEQRAAINNQMKRAIDKIKKTLDQLSNIENPTEEQILVALNKSKKAGPKRKKGYLDYFEKKEQDKVKKIIPLLEQFNPDYCKTIYTLYTKDLILKEVDGKLPKTINNDIKNVRHKINAVLEELSNIENPTEEQILAVLTFQAQRGKAKRLPKANFLDYFSLEDREKVKMIFPLLQQTDSIFYEAIYSYYDEDFTLKKQTEIAPLGNEIFNAKRKIDNLLKVLPEIEKLTEENILAILKEQNRYKRKRKSNFLENFEKEDWEKVKLIIFLFQQVFPHYYEAIYTFYTEELKRKELKQKADKKIVSNLQSAITKIKLVLKELSNIENPTEEDILNVFKKQRQHGRLKKNNFLDYFEKEESNKVKQIIPILNHYFPHYYEAIYTFYTEELTLKMKYEKESKSINNSFVGAIRKIKQILEKLNNIENSTDEEIEAAILQGKSTNSQKEEKITLLKNMDRPFYLDNASKLTCSILSLLSQEKGYSFLELMELTGASEEEVLSVIVEYLDYFENSSDILLDILRKSEMGFSIIINSYYFQNVLSYLTEKEQLLLILKLKFYQDKSLTNNRISKIIGLSMEELEQYEIMTNNDKTNSFNKIIKKVR